MTSDKHNLQINRVDMGPEGMSQCNQLSRASNAAALPCKTRA